MSLCDHGRTLIIRFPCKNFSQHCHHSKLEPQQREAEQVTIGMAVRQPSNSHMMRGTPQRLESATHPSSFPKHWAPPLIVPGERLPSDQLPANTRPYLPTPTAQLVERAGDDHHDDETGARGSKPTIRVSLSTEDKLAQHRGRSRTPHQSYPETVSHRTSTSPLPGPVAQARLKYDRSPVRRPDANDALQHAPSRPLPGTNAADFLAPRARVACRFSYEDYKHTQVMGWLERDVVGKEVIKGLVPTPLSSLTVTTEMSTLDLGD